MAQPRRVLHVVHGYYPESTGGTEAYVQMLLASQLALGLEPSLLHGSFEPRGTARLEQRTDLPVPALRLHRADAWSDYWDRSHYAPARPLIEDVLHRQRPDLVHVHQWIRLTDDLVAISEAAGVPAVVSLHDVSASCPSCFRLRPDDSHCERVVSFESCHDCVPLRGGESRAEVELGIDYYAANARNELRRARRVLAATHATADLVTRGLGLPADLVHILPLGYEPRFGERPCSVNDGARLRSPLRVAYWGNITHRKGVQVLLRALRQAGDRVELHLFGRVDRPELEQELHTLASGLPVTFHGRFEYPQIAALAPDLAVFPSTCFETYGFVLDEAFELGVPVLVTDVGAFAERLHGAGLAVPPNDPAALAAALRRVLDEPGLLPAWRSLLPRTAPTPQQHVLALLEHYERALSARPGPVDDGLDAKRARLAALRAVGARDAAPTRRGL